MQRPSRAEMLETIRTSEVELDRLLPDYNRKEVERARREHDQLKAAFSEQKVRMHEMQKHVDKCQERKKKLTAHLKKITEKNEELAVSFEEKDQILASMRATQVEERNRLRYKLRFIKEEHQQKLHDYETFFHAIKHHMQQAKDELNKTQAAHKFEKNANGEALAIVKLQGEATKRQQKINELNTQARQMETSIAAATEDEAQSMHQNTRLKVQLAGIETAKDKMLAKLDCLITEKSMKQDLNNLTHMNEKAASHIAVCNDIINRHSELLLVEEEEEEEVIEVEEPNIISIQDNNLFVRNLIAEYHGS
ncbi:coiled-coil domain-containing protein 158-like isoform X2 [Ambystoma mexicanum]